MAALRTLWSDTRQKKGLLFLALPGILLLLVFNYLPMFGVFIAFKSIDASKGIMGSPWIGLENFKFFFLSDTYWRVTRNTVLLNMLFIFVTFVLAIGCALILYEMTKRAVKIYQTVLFMPYLLSWVVISYITYIFLNNDYGVLNRTLDFFNLPSVSWYSESAYWPFILLVSYVWKNIGYTTIILYTGLLGIDSSYYEAASIDGANWFQKIWRISLPSLQPLFVVLLLTQLGRIFFSDFGLFYFIPMNSPLLYSTTDVIDTYVYRSLQQVADLGMPAAVGLYQSLLGFVLVIAINAVIRKFNEENSLF